MAQIPLRRNNKIQVLSYFVLNGCTNEFKRLKLEYWACASVEDKKEKSKRKGEVISKIKALLIRVSDIGEPGIELREVIKSFLKRRDAPRSLVEELIDYRDGGFSVPIMQPVLKPKNRRGKKNILVNSIDIRGAQTITAPNTKIKPLSPRDRILEELEVSKHKLPHRKEEKFRIK